jgi:superfamily I DNA and/or RNA helicase
VILVGDHRQLPQLLDETLVPDLSTRHDKDVVEAVLNRSLFERLFVALQKEERQGGAARVVTLDRQFRMHPVLGDFVSEQFYAPHGEPLGNGIPDTTQFAHGLARYGDAACAWLDARGPGEERVGKSLRRSVEARVIVDELEECLRASSDLTFGVIAFYGGQVAAINDLLLARGLAVRSEAGVLLNPGEPWLFDGRGLPRVRVGTVDAFQGREFDVVFLSTTRSTPPDRDQRRRFGFLVLPNRLCVAMSRQRRLLVTVGDAGMFTSDAGRAAVPWLAAFHDLAGGEFGVQRAVG